MEVLQGHDGWTAPQRSSARGFAQAVDKPGHAQRAPSAAGAQDFRRGVQGDPCACAGVAGKMDRRVHSRTVSAGCLTVRDDA